MEAENVIREKSGRSVVQLAVDQLRNPLIITLIIAASITWGLGDYTDSVIILLAVFINTILGFVQEYQAQNSLKALNKLLMPTATVTREGKTQEMPIRNIRVGDVVSLKPGDRIPADGRLSAATNLFVNEAILTGESLPVYKSPEADKKLYSGTIVTSGRGKLVVELIGMNTRLGAIAQTLETTSEPPTPLQAQLNKLARKLVILVFIVSTFIFIIGLIRGQSVADMLSLTVAVAVAAIPEGMVVSLTVILSIGMQKILKRKAIVRRLLSAETLGSVTTLAIDKTGTLTEGVMRVTKVKVVDLDKAVKVATYANNLENPIDLALWEWVQGQDHYDPQKMNEETPRISEVMFDSKHKYMSVTNAEGEWLKGAPEKILLMTNLNTTEQAHWMKLVNEFAYEGLRVIGFGLKHAGKEKFEFIGIAGISDKVRSEAKEAIQICQRAGVEIKIVTGDYRVTSEAIMNNLGLQITDPSREIIEGKELADLSDLELGRRVKDIKLFCRVTPEQKLRIVKALEDQGEVVAMTGDGVNDALALKRAGIGIVVADAADVAKETADLVLLDSNLKTIVAAIEEARIMFLNIRKVVLYLLSDAFTEILLIVAAILGSFPTPLTAIQILWINILSDGLPNLALAVEPKEYEVMHLPPRAQNDQIINRRMQVTTLILSISKAVLAFAAFALIFNFSGNLSHARTLVFAIVGSGSLMYVFSTRNLRKPIYNDNLLKNPWLVAAVIIGLVLQLVVIYNPQLSGVFQSYPLGIADWVVVVLTGAILILFSELGKRLYRNR